MQDGLIQHFRAFELLEDDSPMRGFKRVCRCVIRDYEKVLGDPGFGFKPPFDVRFTKAMVRTLTHVLASESAVSFGFIEHDGFSLLLGGPDETQHNGTGRSLVSRMASLAASKMSLLLGDLATFDVHLYQFPSPDLARAYFQWRQKVNTRFAMDRYVRHVLAKDGDGDPEQLESLVADFGDEEKLEILTQHQVSWAELPSWQRHGSGIYWDSDRHDPDLAIDTTLPIGPGFNEYLKRFV